MAMERNADSESLVAALVWRWDDGPNPPMDLAQGLADEGQAATQGHPT